MVDQFPFLEWLDQFLAWLILFGIIVSGVSVVIVGIAYLPVFAFLLDERRDAWARNALRGTAIGLAIILIALPMRNWIIVHYFPVPVGLPPIPVTKPFPSPTPMKVH